MQKAPDTDNLSAILDTALVVLVGVSFVALAWGMISDRSMWQDASFWYLSILNSKQSFFDPNYFRWADTVLQLPAIAILHLADGDHGLNLAISLLNFTYTFHPAISLVASWLILRRKGMGRWVIYPLLSYALASGSTHTDSVGTVSITLSYFWPAFFLTLGPPPTPKWRTIDSATLCFLYLALMFSYESAGVLFLPLIAILVHNIFFNAERPLAVEPLLLAISGLALIFISYRLLAGPHGNLAGSWSRGFQPYQIFSLSACIGSCILTLAYAFTTKDVGAVRKAAFALTLFSVLAGVYYCLHAWGLDFSLKPHFGHLFRQAYIARLTAAPVASFFAISAGLLYFSRRAKTDKYFWLGLRGITIVALVMYIAFDLASTWQWVDDLHRVRQLVHSTNGCKKIGTGTFRKDIGRNVINPENFQSIAILENRSFNLKNLFTVIDDTKLSAEARCAQITSGALQTDMLQPLRILKNGFVFDRVQSEVGYR